MEANNGVAGASDSSPPMGCYLLVVVSEPVSEDHKETILQRLNKGLLSWDVIATGCDLTGLENVCATVKDKTPQDNDLLIQYSTEALGVEVLVNPTVSTLKQCIKNLLASSIRHKHLIHAGYTFSGSGSWILQNGTFSFREFLNAFQDAEVQNQKGCSIHVHCAEEGEWTNASFEKESFTKVATVFLNPVDKADVLPGSQYLTECLSSVLSPHSLGEIMEASPLVGNIRFKRPTLYVFPGGQGDCALFGINGFNLLVDGGFNRKPCSWEFIRHLDRLDAVLVTRLSESNLCGMSTLMKRKALNNTYPQIGYVFCNIAEGRSPSPADEIQKDKSNLLVSVVGEGHNFIHTLNELNLKPHQCWRDSATEPIVLYHKVGHGTLEMHVLSPPKDSKEMKDFLQEWSTYKEKFSCIKSGLKHKNQEATIPLSHATSICAILVWRPSDPKDTITRILFPGSAPQSKILEGLEKLKNLDILKQPHVTKASLSSVLVSKPKSKIERPTVKAPIPNRKNTSSPSLSVSSVASRNGDISGPKKDNKETKPVIDRKPLVKATSKKLESSPVTTKPTEVKKPAPVKKSATPSKREVTKPTASPKPAEKTEGKKSAVAKTADTKTAKEVSNKKAAEAKAGSKPKTKAASATGKSSPKQEKTKPTPVPKPVSKLAKAAAVGAAAAGVVAAKVIESKKEDEKKIEEPVVENKEALEQLKVVEEKQDGKIEPIISPVPETVTSPALETVPSPTPETVPLPTPEIVPSPVPETVSSPVQETAPSPLPGTVASSVPENISSTAPETVSSPVQDSESPSALKIVSEPEKITFPTPPETAESTSPETISPSPPDTVSPTPPEIIFAEDEKEVNEIKDVLEQSDALEAEPSNIDAVEIVSDKTEAREEIGLESELPEITDNFSEGNILSTQSGIVEASTEFTEVEHSTKDLQLKADIGDDLMTTSFIEEKPAEFPVEEDVVVKAKASIEEAANFQNDLEMNYGEETSVDDDIILKDEIEDVVEAKEAYEEEETIIREEKHYETEAGSKYKDVDALLAGASMEGSFCEGLTTNEFNEKQQSDFNANKHMSEIANCGKETVENDLEEIAEYTAEDREEMEDFLIQPEHKVAEDSNLLSDGREFQKSSDDFAHQGGTEDEILVEDSKDQEVEFDLRDDEQHVLHNEDDLAAEPQNDKELEFDHHQKYEAEHKLLEDEVENEQQDSESDLRDASVDYQQVEIPDKYMQEAEFGKTVPDDENAECLRKFEENYQETENKMEQIEKAEFDRLSKETGFEQHFRESPVAYSEKGDYGLNQSVQESKYSEEIEEAESVGLNELNIDADVKASDQNVEEPEFSQLQYGESYMNSIKPNEFAMQNTEESGFSYDTKENIDSSVVDEEPTEVVRKESSVSITYDDETDYQKMSGEIKRRESGTESEDDVDINRYMVKDEKEVAEPHKLLVTIPSRDSDSDEDDVVKSPTPHAIVDYEGPIGDVIKGDKESDLSNSNGECQQKSGQKDFSFESDDVEKYPSEDKQDFNEKDRDSAEEDDEMVRHPTPPGEQHFYEHVGPVDGDIGADEMRDPISQHYISSPLMRQGQEVIDEPLYEEPEDSESERSASPVVEQPVFGSVVAADFPELVNVSGGTTPSEPQSPKLPLDGKQKGNVGALEVLEALSEHDLDCSESSTHSPLARDETNVFEPMESEVPSSVKISESANEESAEIQHEDPYSGTEEKQLEMNETYEENTDEQFQIDENVLVHSNMDSSVMGGDMYSSSIITSESHSNTATSDELHSSKVMSTDFHGSVYEEKEYSMLAETEHAGIEYDDDEDYILEKCQESFTGLSYATDAFQSLNCNKIGDSDDTSSKPETDNTDFDKEVHGNQDERYLESHHLDSVADDQLTEEQDHSLKSKEDANSTSVENDALHSLMPAYNDGQDQGTKVLDSMIADEGFHPNGFNAQSACDSNIEQVDIDCPAVKPSETASQVIPSGMNGQETNTWKDHSDDYNCEETKFNPFNSNSSYSELTANSVNNEKQSSNYVINSRSESESPEDNVMENDLSPDAPYPVEADTQYSIIPDHKISLPEDPAAAFDEMRDNFHHPRPSGDGYSGDNINYPSGVAPKSKYHGDREDPYGESSEDDDSSSIPGTVSPYAYTNKAYAQEEEDADGNHLYKQSMKIEHPAEDKPAPFDGNNPQVLPENISLDSHTSTRMTYSPGFPDMHTADPNYEFRLEDWGKPMGLPTPPETTQKTAKKTPKSTTGTKSLSKTAEKRSSLDNGKVNSPGATTKSVSSPAKSAAKSKGTAAPISSPVYVDLAYVPHHGDPHYCDVEFFKKIRARYYVFSGTNPSKEVFNALLEAKKGWKEEMEVTIIPTYETDALGYWMAQNQDTLAEYSIDVAASASRCTVNLQDHETSCAAYRLEF